MSWRDFDTAQRSRFVSRIAQRLADRLDFGQRTYGNAFLGDPIDHAEEEALDILAYLEWARRMLQNPVALVLERQDSLTLDDLRHLDTMLKQQKAKRRQV